MTLEKSQVEAYFLAFSLSGALVSRPEDGRHRFLGPTFGLFMAGLLLDYRRVFGAITRGGSSANARAFVICNWQLRQWSPLPYYPGTLGYKHRHTAGRPTTWNHLQVGQGTEKQAGRTILHFNYEAAGARLCFTVPLFQSLLRSCLSVAFALLTLLLLSLSFKTLAFPFVGDRVVDVNGLPVHLGQLPVAMGHYRCGRRRRRKTKTEKEPASQRVGAQAHTKLPCSHFPADWLSCGQGWSSVGM